MSYMEYTESALGSNGVGSDSETASGAVEQGNDGSPGVLEDTLTPS